MSMVSNTALSATEREPVAAELYSSTAGALRSATLIPLMYATNPSLYLIRKNRLLTDEGSATLNGIRRYADGFTFLIAASMFVVTSDPKPVGAGGAVGVER